MARDLCGPLEATAGIAEPVVPELFDLDIANLHSLLALVGALLEGDTHRLLQAGTETLVVEHLEDGVEVRGLLDERNSVLIHVDKPDTWVWHCHILNHVERDTGMFGMVTAVVVS